MRKNAGLLVGLALFGACVGSPGDERPQAPGLVEDYDPRGNVRVTYPADWTRADRPLTNLGNPVELLALGTGALPAGGGCAPKAAVGAARPGDVIVFLVEDPATAGNEPPPRPETFAPLPPAKPDTCWDTAVSTYRFSDAGGRFQVDVWVGEAVDDRLERDLIAVLDSLEFGRGNDLAPFFARAEAVLKARGFGHLSQPAPDARHRAASMPALRAKVRRRLAREAPQARFIEATLAIFVSTNERLGRYRQLMYVVHTGSFDTGDCLDFYDARTLEYELGSCFLSARDL